VGALVVGALVAAMLRLPERVAATVTAFGGGVLLAAIALVAFATVLGFVGGYLLS
jgi:hypothetical protein